jgi:hypothetical protein
LGILLGGLLVAAGIAETVRLVRSGDGGFAFWFGTLVGGGVLVLTGTLLLPRRSVTGCVLTTIGCVAGLMPTMSTVVAPDARGSVDRDYQADCGCDRPRGDARIARSCRRQAAQQAAV